MQTVRAKTLRRKENYIEKWFHFSFSTKILRLFELYIYFIRRIKKVSALGKISARADDKPGCFLKWPYLKF